MDGPSIPPGTVSALPPIDLIYGTMLVGVFFNCILFGIMVMQCFIYYQTYSSDRLWLRLFVAYLALVEAVNTACDMYVVYQPLVLQFGKIEAVTFFPKTLSAAAVVTVLISTPVQIFMAWRISVIMGTKMVALIIAAFSLLSFAGGTWVTINVAVIKAFSKKNSFEFNRPGVVWFVASAITDVLITFTLVYSLHHRRTGHLKTTNAINRIIRLTVQTGLVTMIFALLDLLLFTLDSKTAISFVFDFSVSKLYTNALLSTLNARAGWSNLNNGDDDNVLFGTTANYTNSRSRTSGPASEIAIRKTAAASGTTLGDKYELTAPKSGNVSINVNTQVHSDGSDPALEGGDYQKVSL